jgi:hypothetical protein
MRSAEISGISPHDSGPGKFITLHGGRFFVARKGEKRNYISEK